jgi:hypothetical protein
MVSDSANAKPEPNYLLYHDFHDQPPTALNTYLEFGETGSEAQRITVNVARLPELPARVDRD